MASQPSLRDALEAGQLVAQKMQPYPRRALSRGTFALLVALRVYVAIAIPIVIYAFVHALMKAQ